MRIPHVIYGLRKMSHKVVPELHLKSYPASLKFYRYIRNVDDKFK